MSDQSDIAAQVGGVWNGVMGAMTAQGATREDIANMARETANAVLTMTADALWPRNAAGAEREIPDGEANLFGRIMEGVNATV